MIYFLIGLGVGGILMVYLMPPFLRQLALELWRKEDSERRKRNG